MKPIYEPAGRAKEYGDLAINIYTGCNHGCTYCFAPLVLKRDREKFHTEVAPRNGIVEAVKRQLDKERITGKLIHLCFSCDPYPDEIDTTPTRDIIRAFINAGNHVQILTKGGLRAQRDFDLLFDSDWFGVTYAGYVRDKSDFGAVFKPITEEPNASNAHERLITLERAHKCGIKTWVSCEPVLCADDIYDLIRCADYIDRFKIGKLNYAKSDINWREFGLECERLCRLYNRDYYIKEDLRKLMG